MSSSSNYTCSLSATPPWQGCQPTLPCRRSDACEAHAMAMADFALKYSLKTVLSIYTVPKATTTSEFRNSTVHVDRDHVYIHSQLSTSTAAPIVKSTGHIAKTQIRGSQHNSSSILSKMNPAENSTGTSASSSREHTADAYRDHGL